jgi:hypothetical protein
VRRGWAGIKGSEREMRYTCTVHNHNPA